MSSDVFHARHEGLFPTTALDDKRALVVGAGSVGSFFAELLVRSGLRHLVVADNDRVSTSNLCRTIYTEDDVGEPKVEALRRHLEAIRPEVHVDAEYVDVGTLDDEVLSEWIAESDLVIAVTDHPPTQSRLAALSYHEKPAVFAGVYAKGTGGEVLFTLPDQTPCYHCVLGGIRAEHRPNRGKLDYGLATGELQAEPALGVDILHVTTCAAKVALALLLRETDSHVARILDPERSVLFVGNQVDWIWQAPFETVWAHADRKEKCLCRLRPGESTADLVDCGEVVDTQPSASDDASGAQDPRSDEASP